MLVCSFIILQNPLPSRIRLLCVVRQVENHIRNQFRFVIQAFIWACEVAATYCSLCSCVRKAEGQDVAEVRRTMTGCLSDDDAYIVVAGQCQEKTGRAEGLSAADEYDISFEDFLRIEVQSMI